MFQQAIKFDCLVLAIFQSFFMLNILLLSSSLIGIIEWCHPKMVNPLPPRATLLVLMSV